MKRGIKMTADLLAACDHDQLVAKVARCLTACKVTDGTLARSMGMMAQYMRRDAGDYTPNSKDEAEGRDALVFTGDTVPPRGPPLAWVLLWEGVYVNIYGAYVPEDLKEWGWVFWDECRLVEVGAKQLIADRWKVELGLLGELKLFFPWLAYLGGHGSSS